jgi:hypothetical protein
MEEEQARYIAGQSPVMRIKESVDLILRILSQNSKKPNATRIYFDKE